MTHTEYDPQDAAVLLRRLLRALGVEVVAPTDGELAHLAGRTIADLRKGSTGGADNRRQASDGNPLIPGGLDGAKIQPVYMSLTGEDEIADHMARLMGCAEAGDDDGDGPGADFIRLVERVGK